jgi:hypothetical protein
MVGMNDHHHNGNKLDRERKLSYVLSHKWNLVFKKELQDIKRSVEDGYQKGGVVEKK